ncbi:Glyoxalase/Bleomycin resistance protein/Dioxygenase superfamily protein [Paraburkholderia steynii]|uniref:Glyoxalase/Bleomycin resistance protein/Dioxygenase superfamily protein n=1 Tax=Paraburkholderia steynii TaxID=1245441 RepID=A0A7Z7FJX4_9BURK|nr:VOC family protein [Paraburkholderia steynii]SDI69750.1 Glyoxalase/Bleomycin resistance protein/Dioxygenase superfamily protein [Paraburkholderia steynii]
MAQIIPQIPEITRIPVNNQDSVIKPYVLGHGTLACRDINETRAFYKEFLGLETVRHGPRSFAVRLGMKFHIFSVEIGDEIEPVPFLNHWGLDVTSKEEVDAAYEKTVALKEKYKIRQITEPALQHGVYSFYLEDMDYNWWEVQYYEGNFQDDDLFDFGDLF